MPAVSIEAWAARLLSATEALHAALVAGEQVEGLEAAWNERLDCFEALRFAVGAGDPVGPAVRAHVARVRELDAELIAYGQQVAEAIRDERHALDRRRAVIQAHTRRERPEPRAMSIKA